MHVPSLGKLMAAFSNGVVELLEYDLQRAYGENESVVLQHDVEMLLQLNPSWTGRAMMSPV